MTNLFLTFFFTLIPIYSFCLFDLIFSGEFIQKKFDKTLFNETIDLVKRGFIPNFVPVVLVNDHFDSFSEKNFYPIGSLPSKDSYVVCNEGYGFINYKTDKFGLRNPDKNWDKARNSDTIYLIGDSFVHGYCVEEKHTIRRQLEINSNQNVLNLGFGGNGPNEYISTLRTIVNPILKNSSSKQNDVVIVFYENDNLPENNKNLKLALRASDVAEPYKNNGYLPSKEYLKTTRNIFTKNYPLDKNKIITRIKTNREKVWKVRNTSYKVLTMFPIRKRINFILKKHLEKQSYAPEIGQSILLLSKICKEGCKPHVLFIPANSRKYSHLKKNEYLFIKYLEKLAYSYEVNFIDGSQVIDASLPSNYSPEGGHLSPEGYRKIADLFLKSR